MTQQSSSFSADEIESAIHKALKAGDIQAIQPLMVQLALTDAGRADDVLSVLKLAVKLRG